MPRNRPPAPRALVLGLLLFLSRPAAQGGPPPAGGVDREAMWPAPAAEDWERPVAITFERSFEDALALARTTHRPILVCVNMDGEIASEHYAGLRYRDPALAPLFEPYICLIASVYRHTPRDYDEAGRRILCPRFGSVTCGEHIAIEPILYERFFEGQRVAPRHIMLELDGSETYDVFYAWDTASVFEAIQTGIAERKVETRPLPSGDRPLVELVQSPSTSDREALERAFADGSKEERQALLDAAQAAGGEPPVELLRLALYGLDAGQAQTARRLLARSSAPAAVDLIGETLSASLAAVEREELIGALERIGIQVERARTLAVVHRGLARASESLDVDGWRAALADGSAPARPALPKAFDELAAQVDYAGAAARARPADGALELALAEAWLGLAVDPKTANVLGSDPRTKSAYARLQLEDARGAAERARALGEGGWRATAVLALSAYYLGEKQAGYKAAETALSEIPPGETRWSAMALVALFAEGRQQAIAAAVREKTDWPASWMTDVHAAYSVIARHPLGSDLHAVAHHDFLQDFGAAGEARRVLDEGLARFPLSPLLHDRLRSEILASEGAARLEAAYAARLPEAAEGVELGWFRSYTALVSAEFQRRARAPEEARAAYQRGIAGFEAFAAARPAERASADHYIALALAGLARIALEADDVELALEQLLASFKRRPEAAANLDGLGISPVGTAQMLRSRCVATGREAEAKAVLAALERLHALDPALLELPAFERGGPQPPRSRRD
jgi:hypothetical protein